jgi:hypothetical protein
LQTASTQINFSLRDVLLGAALQAEVLMEGAFTSDDAPRPHLQQGWGILGVCPVLVAQLAARGRVVSADPQQRLGLGVPARQLAQLRLRVKCCQVDLPEEEEIIISLNPSKASAHMETPCQQHSADAQYSLTC